MAHRKQTGTESGVCEPRAYLEGCSSIMGLWHKKVLEQRRRQENEARLIAAGFLLPKYCEPPAPSPKPREKIPFAEWAKRHPN